MADLIDRDELIKGIRSTPNFGKDWDKALCEAIVKAAPTVDAVPLVHGHWIGEDYDGYTDGFRNPVYYTYSCSECGKLFETDDEPIDFEYCPRCGSKMDEDGEQDD